MRRAQSGSALMIAIVGILLIIAATLIASWWNSAAILHAQRCQNDLIAMQQMERNWQQSKRSGSPDTGLCRQINDRVDQYNQTCGDDFGKLPKLSCG